MAEAMGHVFLKDEHLVKLSQRIPSERELLELGVNGLKLKDYVIKTALYNHNRDIQSATYEVLSSWLKRYESREEAFGLLETALKECNMKSLAEELLGWIANSSASSQTLQERQSKIREWTRESLLDKTFTTVKGKIWLEKTPNNIPLDKMYTKLSLVKKHREFDDKITTESLSDINEVLRGQDAECPSSLRVLASGSGGNGKTTAMKHFAISWAKGSAEELKGIDFVFHIALKAVKSNEPIEKIIIAQHKGLKGNSVQPDEVRRLLQNFTKQRIIILLDGYDEYSPGTNDDIDKGITKDYLWNCTVVVTSRDTKELRELRNSMDTEIEIIGFDNEGVEDYATKFLEGPEKSKELLAHAEACDINNRLVDYGILHIPIFLHMICYLFKNGILMMKGKVAVISAIVERCLNYESIRKTEKKRKNDGTEVIANLGRLALKGLQTEHFVFKENEIVATSGEEAFELGLLTVVDPDPVAEEEETRLFQFRHLLFQEFSAGKFVSMVDMDLLNELFPTWQTIMKYQEVFKFACGLVDKRVAKEKLDFIYRKLIEYIMVQTEVPDYMFESEVAFLKSLLKETPTDVKMDPLHNRYINYVTKSDTRVFIPSQVYIIGPGIYKHGLIKYKINKKLLAKSTPAAECVLKLEDEDADEMLRVLLHIKKYQEVSISYLDWKHVVFVLADEDDIDNLTRQALTISRNCTSIRTWECTIYTPQYEHIVRQLKDCPKLQRLDLGEVYKLDVGKAVAAAISLRELYLYDCRIPEDVYQTIAKELPRHIHLERLRINKTRGIPEEFGKALAGMKSFKQLYAKECYMAKRTSRSFLSSLAKCDGVEDLRLSNNILSGCLPILLQSSRFTSLKILWLNNTHLKQEDINALSSAIRSKRMPKLEHLDVSYNKMANNLEVLLCGENHPGFPCLARLGLINVQLCKEDLLSISKAVDENKLPSLRHLLLGKNDLPKMKVQLQKTVKSCIKRYTKLQVVLHFFKTGLSYDFLNRMRVMCEETVICISEN